MKALQIRWQRLVNDSGETCSRCGITEEAVQDATRTLKRSLEGLGVDVTLKMSRINNTDFEKAPLESNRIWVAHKPLEDWLSATTGQSQCSAACGDSDCRTIVVGGKAYEAITPEMIVKAGLLASAELIDESPQSGSCSGSCDPHAPEACSTDPV